MISETDLQKHLEDEDFLIARPSLMREVGIAEALMVQRLHFKSIAVGVTCDEGYRWVKWSVADWMYQMKGTMSDKTVRTKLQKLEDAGYIKSRNAGGMTRTKEYTVAVKVTG